jgi:squalene-hopene/tetraprenyl-beta-curcumene cyclase
MRDGSLSDDAEIVRDTGPRALLEQAIERATDALLGQRRPDGHWAFELEADATIPAEYLLLRHYLAEPDDGIEAKIAVYLRAIQGDHGGWPLFHGGPLDVSATTKAYFALKMIGDPPDAPHMTRARDALHAAGGAAKANVFTRILLALYGEVPWDAVPVMPVEIMNLPRWFPFHIGKISYWSRTVLVPLLVLMTLKPCARNPRGVRVQELFTTPPDEVSDWFAGPVCSQWGHLFRALDRVLRRVEPLFPETPRRRAIDRAVAFTTERLNGEDGLGAIYPAMANAVMMFDCLGMDAGHPDRATARQAIEKLLIVEGDSAYCQPCLSPIWDTALAAHALAEVGDGRSMAAARLAGEWMVARQVTDVVGDWADARPGVLPGGWPFQYANPHYPDLDDTAVVVMALDRVDARAHAAAIARAREWVLGLQSRNGGWGAFDADNAYDYLNHIPFADHGALLDPPTSDVTARCLSMLAQLGYGRDDPAVKAGLDFLFAEQEPEGCWFGRWGTNYVYGTWSVLCALNALGIEPDHPAVTRAVAWLRAVQNPDGGWGESGESYWDGQAKGRHRASTPSQTAWALLGLMAAGHVDDPEVAAGIDHLTRTQNDAGLWDEPDYTAVGFPRVFYLRYHGYRAYFPLWTLARYRNLSCGNAKTPLHGM